MWQTLSDLFNWQWAIQSIAWAIVGSVAMRAWVWWRSGKGHHLSRKREVTFWILAPLTILVFLALIASISRNTQRPKLVPQIQVVNIGALEPPENKPYVLLAATI